MTRFHQRIEPIYHKPLDIDARGFVYVYGLKVARYYADRQTLEFVDHRRAANEPARTVEVKAGELGAGLLRLIEAAK